MSALNSLPYFHGTIDTRECRELLPEMGDFLIRNHIKEMDKDSTVSSCVLTTAVTPDQASRADKMVPSDYSLKKECTTRLKSFAITGDAGSFALQGTSETFPTVQALCESFIENKKDLPSGGVLKKGIPRMSWQLLLGDLQFPASEDVLGNGSYGKVIKAKLMKKDGDPVDVAVKSTVEGNGDESITEMYKEARAMRRLIHPNIIRLEGVVVEKLPILLVIEFFDGSCLLGALQKKKVTDVMRFPVICGIMYGLLYIHSQTYIHRDIAARNVMVSADFRNVKIIDFGLAKHGTRFILSATQKIPVKWLAPEVLQTWTFSTKSDVWAFAVTCWEVYHDGAEPYSNVKNVKLKDNLKNRKGEMGQDTLQITENLEHVPKGFDAIYGTMFCKNTRDRAEMSWVATEMEKIFPNLPKPVFEEVRLHLERRPPIVSKLASPSNASHSKNLKKPLTPTGPKEIPAKNLKTTTRRRKKKPSGEGGAKDPKVVTLRRKKKG
ncbi:unnamed protein product [Caenorhabditis sp. 36 PRJEB53466]|nr:unnamed protein product [Caenorhabditis sp. 36 PRJEB53466]